MENQLDFSRFFCRARVIAKHESQCSFIKFLILVRNVERTNIHTRVQQLKFDATTYLLELFSLRNLRSFLIWYVCLAGLQPIYKCDLGAAWNLVYCLFLTKEVLLEIQLYNFLGANSEDFLCMVLFSLIHNHSLKLSRIYNHFILIKPSQGNFTFRF